MADLTITPTLNFDADTIAELVVFAGHGTLSELDEAATSDDPTAALSDIILGVIHDRIADLHDLGEGRDHWDEAADRILMMLARDTPAARG